MTLQFPCYLLTCLFIPSPMLCEEMRRLSHSIHIISFGPSALVPIYVMIFIFHLLWELQSCTFNSLMGITTWFCSIYLISSMSKTKIFFSQNAPPPWLFLIQCLHQPPSCLTNLEFILISILFLILNTQSINKSIQFRLKNLTGYMCSSHHHPGLCCLIFLS